MVRTYCFRSCGPGFVDLRSHSLCSVMHTREMKMPCKTEIAQERRWMPFQRGALSSCARPRSPPVRAAKTPQGAGKAEVGLQWSDGLGVGCCGVPGVRE